MISTDNGDTNALREDTQALLKHALHNATSHHQKKHVALLPSGETRKLLGTLLRNATIPLGSVGASSHRPNAPSSWPYEKRRYIQAVHEFSNLLDQLIHNLESIIDNYRYAQGTAQLRVMAANDHIAGDLRPLLNAVKENDQRPTTARSTANRDTQALYALRVTFRNVDTGITSLQDSIDNSKCISLSHVVTIINQLCNCSRSLMRLLRILSTRLTSLDMKSISQVKSFSRSIQALMGQLSAYSQKLISIAFSAGHSPDDHLNESLKKLEEYISMFELEILQSLEEKRYLLSLLSELEMKRVIQQTEMQKTSAAKSRSRLVYHRPDFKPKGFLLPLPLAHRRYQRQNQRTRSKHAPPPAAAPASDRVAELERRLAVLEDQLRIQDHAAAPIETHVQPDQDRGTSFAPQQWSGIPDQIGWFDHNDDIESDNEDMEEVDLIAMVCDSIPKPSNISDREWREVVTEAVDELVTKISELCDDIIDDIFVREIRRMTASNLQ